MPNRIGRQAAIIEERASVGKTPVVDILIARKQQLVERRERQSILGHDASELTEQQRMNRRRATVRDSVQPRAKVGDARMPLRVAQPRFVRNIASRAHHLIDNADRRAQRLWQQHARNRKIFVLIDVHPASLETIL